jgi:hypothetical protein
MNTTAKKKAKPSPSVESVKQAIGRTWFDVSDEDDRIDIETRQHGDVGSETAGKQDIAEGRRILKDLRKAFPQSKWVTKFDVVDEWVSVSVRKEPLTPREKAERKQQALIAKLRERLTAVTADANARTQKQGCRNSFSCCVYDGCSYIKVSIKVVFGQRLLYHNHLGAGFYFANEEAASEAIDPLVAGFPEFEWARTTREPQPRRTGNYSPPNNVIEHEGYVEYEHQIRKVR